MDESAGDGSRESSTQTSCYPVSRSPVEPLQVLSTLSFFLPLSLSFLFYLALLISRSHFTSQRQTLSINLPKAMGNISALVIMFLFLWKIIVHHRHELFISPSIKLLFNIPKW
jgi:hypothetical protein